MKHCRGSLSEVGSRFLSAFSDFSKLSTLFYGENSMHLLYSFLFSSHYTSLKAWMSLFLYKPQSPRI